MLCFYKETASGVLTTSDEEVDFILHPAFGIRLSARGYHPDFSQGVQIGEHYGGEPGQWIVRETDKNQRAIIIKFFEDYGLQKVSLRAKK